MTDLTGAATRRADARHNTRKIVDAAVACLTEDPGASMTAIARAACVGRVTLYGHFSSREALLEAALQQVLDEGDEVLGSLDLAGDPRVALATLIEGSWLLTARSTAVLEAAQAALPPGRVQELHAKPARRVEALIRRGQREKVLRTDQPVSWMTSALHHLMKGAALDVAKGRLEQADVPRLLCASVLSAYAPPPRWHAVQLAWDGASSGEERGWTWDPSLYAGSARHYAVGRVSYPAGIATALAVALELDGSGRLLDVGCGPGSLTLLLAQHFAEAVGVDADADVLIEAARLAEERHVDNVSWRHLRAEELPADLPPVRVVTFAQSFHWMDRHRVAAAVRGMLDPGGAVVHVHATTHQGVDSDIELPHPRPPREAITRLVQRYLGPQRRAGQGLLVGGTPGGEDAVYRATGFTGPQRLAVPGQVVERTADQVAASVYSLSGSAPHLFAGRLAEFDAELRQLLADASSDGRFSEQMRSIALDIWR